MCVDDIKCAMFNVLIISDKLIFSFEKFQLFYFQNDKN